MPSQSSSPPNFHTIGLPQAPPPCSSLRQPPLLPLPNAANHRRDAAGRCPRANYKKPNNGSNRRTSRDPSLTPKKSKTPKKEGVERPSERVVGSSTADPMGPDPKDDLPWKGNIAAATKVVVNYNKPFVSSLSAGNICDNANYCIYTNKSLSSVGNQVDVLFSGSTVFTMMSPPPSSLPLPTFSLRSKLTSCRAAGIDAGATDDLRRLLRLL